MVNLTPFFWLLCLFGLLPIAETKFKRVLCYIMVVINLIFGTLVNAIPVFLIPLFSKEMSVFYVYIQIVWNIVFGIFFMTSNVEMLVNINDVKQILLRLNQISPIYDSSFEQKKKMLLKKHSVLILIIVTAQAIAAALVVSISLPHYYIMLYFIIVMELKMFKFIVSYDVIRVKLEILNEDLIYFNKIKYLIHPKMLNDKLKNVREFYEEVHDTVTLMNSAGAYTSLTLFVVMASSFASTTYWLVLGLLKNIRIIGILQYFGSMIPCITTLWIGAHAGQKCEDLGHAINKNLHKLGDSVQDIQLLIQVSNEVAQNPIKFSAAGFFTMNFKFLGSMFTTTLTYLMILVSFDQTPRLSEPQSVDTIKIWMDLFESLF